VLDQFEPHRAQRVVHPIQLSIPGRNPALNGHTAQTGDTERRQVGANVTHPGPDAYPISQQRENRSASVPT